MGRRTTTRWNDVEELDLEGVKKKFHLDDDSKAIKAAVQWVNSYMENVSKTFFPPDYEVILQRRLKTQPVGRKVY